MKRADSVTFPGVKSNLTTYGKVDWSHLPTSLQDPKKVFDTKSRGEFALKQRTQLSTSGSGAYLPPAELFDSTPPDYRKTEPGNQRKMKRLHEMLKSDPPNPKTKPPLELGGGAQPSQQQRAIRRDKYAKKPVNQLLIGKKPVLRSDDGSWYDLGGPPTNLPVLFGESSTLRESFDIAVGTIAHVGMDMPLEEHDVPREYETLEESVSADYKATRTRIDAMFAERENVHRMTSASTVSLTKEGDVTAQETGMNVEAYLATKGELSNCWCEQKWTDILSGYLVKQVEATSSDQAILLTNIRKQYASIFDRMTHMHSDSLWYFDHMVGAFAKLKMEELAKQKVQQEAEALTIEKIASLEAKVAESKVREDAAVSVVREEYEEKIEAMGKTLETLKSILRDMSGDKKKVDMENMLRTLEKARLDIEKSSGELGELRPLKGGMRSAQVSLMMTKEALKARDEECASLKEELEHQKLTVQKLMASENVLSQQLETSLARERELQMTGKEQGEVGDAMKRKNRNEASKPVDLVPDGAKSGGEHNFLCVQCERSIDELVDVSRELEMKRGRRVHCRTLRVLLPVVEALKQPSPSVPELWTRGVMRAVMYCKLRNHAVVNDDDTHMPEFVYTWFQPSKERVNAALVQHLGREKAMSLYEDADSSCWMLYHGVRALVPKTSEAKLFWWLLDETHGDDYLEFYQYCLSVIHTVANETMMLQCRRMININSIGDFEEIYKTYDGSFESSEEEDLPRYMWVGLTECIAASQAILGTTLKEHMGQCEKAIRDIAHASETRIPGFDPKSILKKPNAFGVVDMGGDDDATLVDEAKCVDLFTWLMLMMRIYREEMTVRKASLRVLFNTAARSAEALEDLFRKKPKSLRRTGKNPVAQKPEATLEHIRENLSNPVYADLAFQRAPRNVTVSVQQFVAIMRTLGSSASMTLLLRMYIDAHTEFDGNVGFDAAIWVAEKWRFFSRALAMPPFASLLSSSGLDMEKRGPGLATIVNQHYALMQIPFKTMIPSIPDPLRTEFHRLNDEMTGFFGKGAGKFHGLREVAVYRRLLILAAKIKLVSSERIIPGFGGEVVKGSDPLKNVQRELRALKNIITEFASNETEERFERVRESIASRKLKLAWRTRMDREVGPPRCVRMLMRKGYLKGRGAIRSRRLLRDPQWVGGIVAEVYAAMSDASLSIARVVHAYHLHRFGSESLAERNLHDFFVNVRILGKEGNMNPRIALFAVFCGAPLEENNSFSIREPSSLALLATPQAHSFYLQAVQIVSKKCYSSGVNSDRDIRELPLIPITRTDAELNAEYWLASPDILKRSVEALFLDSISKSDKKELQGKIDDMATNTGTGDLEVDVDSFMVEVMKTWIMIAKENLDRLEQYCQRDHVDEEALLSLDGFQFVVSHCNLIDSPHLSLDSERKAITEAEYLKAIAALDGSPPVKPMDALMSALRRRCVSGFAGSFSSKPSSAISVLRQTEQLEKAYSQYKSPLQQFLKGALRAKAGDEHEETEDENANAEGHGAVTNVEQSATQVRTSLVAFEQQLAAIRIASIKVKDTGLDYQDQDTEALRTVEAGWEAFQKLMANSFLLQRRTAPPNRPAKEAIRDAWATTA